MPTCLIVQHAAPEGAYAIGDALDRAGVVMEVRQVFAGDALPADLAGYGGVVVMGGPMSAQRDDGFPTRTEEVGLLEDALARKVPALGVCLGAQMLALAAGGTVYRGSAGLEVGWGTIELTEEASDDPILAGLPRHLDVLHWHGDTFDLPDDAVHLAASARYTSQAFRIGPLAWGFQFHLEIDRRAIGAFLGAFGDEAIEAGTSPESIEEESAMGLGVLAPWRDLVLSRFAGLVATGGAPQDPASR